MLAKVLCICVVTTVALGQTPGTNYQTADGHVRSESIDPEGNVRGQYSYVDPNGKTITVKYSAGKNGFQVEGDHIPRSPESPPTAGDSSFRTAPHQFPVAQPEQQLPPQFQFDPSAGQQGFFGQPAGQQRLFASPAAAQQGLFSPSSNPYAEAASRAQLAQFGQAQNEAAQFPATPSPQQFALPAGLPATPAPPQFAHATPAPARFAPPEGLPAPSAPGLPASASQFGGLPQFPAQFLQLQRAAQSPQNPQALQLPGPQFQQRAEAPQGVQFLPPSGAGPQGPQFLPGGPPPQGAPFLTNGAAPQGVPQFLSSGPAPPGPQFQQRTQAPQGVQFLPPSGAGPQGPQFLPGGPAPQGAQFLTSGAAPQGAQFLRAGAPHQFPTAPQFAPSSPQFPPSGFPQSGLPPGFRLSPQLSGAFPPSGRTSPDFSQLPAGVIPQPQFAQQGGLPFPTEGHRFSGSPVSENQDPSRGAYNLQYQLSQ